MPFFRKEVLCTFRHWLSSASERRRLVGPNRTGSVRKRNASVAFSRTQFRSKGALAEGPLFVVGPRAPLLRWSPEVSFTHVGPTAIPFFRHVFPVFYTPVVKTGVYVSGIGNLAGMETEPLLRDVLVDAGEEP